MPTDSSANGSSRLCDEVGLGDGVVVDQDDHLGWSGLGCAAIHGAPEAEVLVIANDSDPRKTSR